MNFGNPLLTCGKPGDPAPRHAGPPKILSSRQDPTPGGRDNFDFSKSAEERGITNLRTLEST